MPDLILSYEQLKQVVAHLNACLPEEACGLMGGTGKCASLVLPVENELHSQVRFRMAPQAQFKALLQIESAGLELLAIFHSHPTGPPHPSPTDVAEFYYPGTLALIGSPNSDPTQPVPAGTLAFGFWQIQGFHVIHHEIHAVKLELCD